MNMIVACQVAEFKDDGFLCFLYGPGHTVSELGSHNREEFGAKKTSVGARPFVEMLNGERDGDVGKYIEFGADGLVEFPW